MEKVVKFHVMCPNRKIGLLKGKGQANVARIRIETGSRVSINQSAGCTIVTVSAVEKLDGKSSAIDVVLAVLQFCLEPTSGNFKLSLLVEGRDRGVLGEELFGGWSQQTLTSIILFEQNENTIIF